MKKGALKGALEAAPEAEGDRRAGVEAAEAGQPRSLDQPRPPEKSPPKESSEKESSEKESPEKESPGEESPGEESLREESPLKESLLKGDLLRSFPRRPFHFRGGALPCLLPRTFSARGFSSLGLFASGPGGRKRSRAREVVSETGREAVSETGCEQGL